MVLKSSLDSNWIPGEHSNVKNLWINEKQSYANYTI